MTECTLSMIKPNAVKAGNVGNILAHFEKAGIKIAALKMMYLARREAEAFYAEHKGKPFFDELVGFMSSGPMCAIVLEGDGVIEKNREIMGATDPSKAAPGTLRALYANNMTENAVHGSDSPTSAAREVGFFFPEMEIY
ncbi:MAG: nucleoside-diphosphate kinase [Deltaproteobacteria bacterium]|nr:nucleoside-diphosphate kinase [Deltaproteobacteria bacterium]